MPEPAPEATTTGTHAAGPAVTGRQRLWHALRSPSRRQVIVAVLLALVGFGGVVQIRSNESDSTYAGYREQDLIDVLNGLASTTQRTQTEIDRLSRIRDDLQTESSQRQAALDSAQKDVDSLNVLAGLVPVTGQGVRITITEVSGTVDVSSMLDTIQELRSVGAESIQINGTVRLIAQSSIEESVGGLEIDGTLVESPYVIDAIGLSGTLAAAITFPFGPKAQLIADGAQVDVAELATLDIDAVREPAQPEFAQPAP